MTRRCRRNSFDFSITLRDQECEVEACYEPSDYSVGIIGDGMMEYEISGEDGKPLENITEAEDKAIMDRGQQIIDDGDHYYEPDYD